MSTMTMIREESPAFLLKYPSEKPLFTAHGCVLLELANGDRFDYRAENLKTGRSVRFGHRETPLPESKYRVVAAQMEKCAAGDGWLLADADVNDQHRAPRLREILSSVFEEILPNHGFVSRDKQIELANEILDAFDDRAISLAEAEVGTGKTLAYLVPAVLARRGRLNSGKINTNLPNGAQAPIVIATSSIALQRAIEREYIPALSGILIDSGVIRTPLTQVLRKGKRHYLCERRLAHFRYHADRQTQAILAPLNGGNIVDLAAAKLITPYIKRAICVDDHCNRDCQLYGTCRYMKHMRDAKRGGYDFQVCNHNYLLADILRRSRGEQPLIPDYQAVIIDEAHKFLDAARQMYGCSLSLTELRCVARDVKGFTFAPGVRTWDITHETERILSKSNLLFQFLNKEVPAAQLEDDEAERYTTKIRQKTGNLILALKENIDALSEMLTARAVTTNFEARRGEVIRSLARISDSLSMFAKHSDLVYWLETSETAAANTVDARTRFPVLGGIPKKLGDLLFKDLWSKDIPIILTSGTLSAAGSFEHIKRKMGLDLTSPKRLRETSKPSPFNHRENALIYTSEVTPFPDNQDANYINTVTDEIERLVHASRGRAVVLFTSHDALGRVYTAMEQRTSLPGTGLHYPLFRMGRGEVAVIERFKQSGNGVLFASGAIWEGIDIPGDILSMLIIVRLPFAVPDPVGEWERTLYESLDEYKAKVVVPEMLIKLKQGFGRLIRTERDSGCVAILDSRINMGGAYRGRVLAALPPCRVTSDITEVDRFMRNIKPAAYFQ